MTTSNTERFNSSRFIHAVEPPTQRPKRPAAARRQIIRARLIQDPGDDRKVRFARADAMVWAVAKAWMELADKDDNPWLTFDQWVKKTASTFELEFPDIDSDSMRRRIACVWYKLSTSKAYGIAERIVE